VKGLSIGPTDEIVELAPGLGIAARMMLGKARRRVLAMRKVFQRYRDKLNAISIVARKDNR
jgi:hypothetical protein